MVILNVFNLGHSQMFSESLFPLSQEKINSRLAVLAKFKESDFLSFLWDFRNFIQSSLEFKFQVFLIKPQHRNESAENFSNLCEKVLIQFFIQLWKYFFLAWVVFIVRCYVVFVSAKFQWIQSTKHRLLFFSLYIWLSCFDSKTRFNVMDFF